MNLLGSTKNKITKGENGENILHLEITEVVLVNCNIADKDYEHDSRVLYTIVPNKLFGQLPGISPKKVFKTFDQCFQILKYGLLIKVLNR